MSAQGKARTTTTTATSTSPGSVTVEIGGQKLVVRSDKNPSEVRALANYIGNRVDTLREAAPQVGLDKILMLASMSVVEELFEARSQLGSFQTALQEKVEKCMRLVDDIEETS